MRNYFYNFKRWKAFLIKTLYSFKILCTDMERTPRCTVNLKKKHRVMYITHYLLCIKRGKLDMYIIYICLVLCLLSHSVMSDSLQPNELQPSSVFGIFQARTLEWVAISYSRGSSQLRDRNCISCIVRCIFYHCITQEAHSFLYTKINSGKIYKALIIVSVTTEDHGF